MPWPTSRFHTDYAKPRTYSRGRRCHHHAADGARCITILHRYHEGRWCHAHEGHHQVEFLIAALAGDIEPVDERPDWAPIYAMPVTV